MVTTRGIYRYKVDYNLIYVRTLFILIGISPKPKMILLQIYNVKFNLLLISPKTAVHHQYHPYGMA